MKSHTKNFGLSLTLLFGIQICSIASDLDNKKTYHGLVIDKPYIIVKQKFILSSKDEILAPDINSAANAISEFAFTIHTLPPQLQVANTTVKPALETSLRNLRLPPSIDNSRRYIYNAIYCWSKPDSNRLQFLIEWAHAYNGDRFLDSYVFLKSDNGWEYEKNGSVSARSFNNANSEEQRYCPEGS